MTYGTSKYNTLEITCVIALLKSFLKQNDVTAQQIGVLTPYDAQKSFLRRQINQLENGSLIDVDSVDGFQGKEKELIIFSAVRSNPSKELGFVNDPRRMNVMITRARRGLIIIGDRFSLMNDTANWLPFIEWATSRQIMIHISQLNNHMALQDKSLMTSATNTFQNGYASVPMYAPVHPVPYGEAKLETNMMPMTLPMPVVTPQPQFQIPPNYWNMM